MPPRESRAGEKGAAGVAMVPKVAEGAPDAAAKSPRRRSERASVAVRSSFSTPLRLRLSLRWAAERATGVWATLRLAKESATGGPSVNWREARIGAEVEKRLLLR